MTQPNPDLRAAPAEEQQRTSANGQQAERGRFRNRGSVDFYVDVTALVPSISVGIDHVKEGIRRTGVAQVKPIGSVLRRSAEGGIGPVKEEAALRSGSGANAEVVKNAPSRAEVEARERNLVDVVEVPAGALILVTGHQRGRVARRDERQGSNAPVIRSSI